MTPERWQLVKEVLHRALKRSAGERAAFLEQACGADAALRAEVESLLRAGEETRGFLERPAANPGTRADLLDILRAALADRYVLERELRGGGMSRVFLAREAALGRRVAIKVLPPDLAMGITAERFRREVRLAATLQHPHLVPLLATGETGGLLYYIMPYIEGESLRDLLRRERQLSQGDALRLAREVADALAYAHSRGVVHRDIKPENILLSGGHALVTDFGIARALEAVEDGHHARLTTSGALLGTPTYMSPEQATGERALDGRSDLYSLGCVLYEMLAGHPPFLGGTPQEVLARHVLDPVPPLRSARSDLPERVEQVILKALAKAPADRFQRAEEFAQALVTPDSTTPRSDRGPSAWPRLRGSRSAWAALATVALLSIAIAAGSRLWRAPPRPGVTTPIHRQLTFTGDVGAAALSPDGKLLAYVARRVGAQKLLVGDVSADAALEVASYKEICCIEWSPDNSEVLFGVLALDTLQGTYIVSRFGGPARRIVGSPWSTWGPDGSKIASWEPPGKRIRITDKSTGVATRIPLQGSFTFLENFDWSPAGDRFAFTTFSDGPPRRWTIWTIEADGTGQQKVLEDTLGLGPVQWAPSGGAVYYLRGQKTQELWRVRVSAGKGTARGAPGLVWAGAQFGPDFTISADGRRLLYTRAIRYSNLWVFTRDPAGTNVSGERLTTGTSTDHSPAIAPDDRQVAFVSSASGLVTMPLEGGPVRRLPFLHDSLAGTPAWSPDGQRIAFGAIQRGTPRVWIVDLRGGVSRVFSRSALSFSGGIAWAPGTKILYQASGNRNFRVLDPESEAEQPLLRNDSVGWIFGPQYSPEGGRVAVFWNRTPAPGLWILNLEDESQVLLQRGRYFPVGWSATGHAVYAMEWEVGVEGMGGQRVYELPLREGERTLAAVFPVMVWGVRMTSDGRRFVAAVEEGTSDVWLVENFDPSPPELVPRGQR